LIRPWRTSVDHNFAIERERGMLKDAMKNRPQVHPSLLFTVWHLISISSLCLFLSLCRTHCDNDLLFWSSCTIHTHSYTFEIFIKHTTNIKGRETKTMWWSSLFIYQTNNVTVSPERIYRKSMAHHKIHMWKRWYPWY
jgi:hypothetical protein